MKLWKFLACFDLGIWMAVGVCVMMVIWQDDPLIDEKLGNTAAALVLVGVLLAFVATWANEEDM